MCILPRYFNYWTTRMNVEDDNTLFDRLFLNIYCLQTMRDVNMEKCARDDFYRRDAFYIWNRKKIQEYRRALPCFRGEVYYGRLNYEEQREIVQEYNKLNKTDETVATFFYSPTYNLY